MKRRGLLWIALIAVPVVADDVYLRGGGQVSGEIVERTEEFVRIDVGGGGSMTVNMSAVVSIAEGTSSLQEYRARAAKIGAGDAASWRDLAKWAEGQVLATQARQAWTQVVAILPNDAAANRALGRVELGGQWVREDEGYRARGYVEFEGEWMQPAERQAILAERESTEAADELALNEQVAAEQESAAVRDAEKRAADDAFWKDNLPRQGDAVYWGWGNSGPVYWPNAPAANTYLDLSKAGSGR